MPETEVTSLGSAIFAFLAAGTFKNIEEAQDALCPKYRVDEPDPRVPPKSYGEFYGLYRKLYFGFGRADLKRWPSGACCPKCGV